MFAVIFSGGKQYKVAPNELVVLEKIEAEDNAPVTFDQVLMINDGKKVKLGAPYVKGGQVKGVIVKQVRGDKIIVFKKKRRHNYRRKKGHRQDLTMVRIQEVVQG